MPFTGNTFRLSEDTSGEPQHPPELKTRELRTPVLGAGMGEQSSSPVADQPQGLAAASPAELPPSHHA